MKMNEAVCQVQGKHESGAKAVLSCHKTTCTYQIREEMKERKEKES